MPTFIIGFILGTITGFAIFYGVCKLIARVDKPITTRHYGNFATRDYGYDPKTAGPKPPPPPAPRRHNQSELN